MENNKDLIITQEDFDALEELVELLKRNHTTAEKNMKSRRTRLLHAVSTLENIKDYNGL